MIYMTRCETAYTETPTLIDDVPYPQHAHIIPETFKNAKRGMAYPPHKLIDRVVTEDVLAYVENNPVEGKTGFIFAAGNQGWMGNNGRYDKNPEAELHYKVKLQFIVLTNIYAGRIASMFGVQDHVSTDASACASSLKVLMDVQNLINNFGFDRVIVLGAEDGVNNLILEFFGESGASLQYKDEDKRQPSAFDDINGGFFIGQGAVLAIFERERPSMDAPIAKFLGAYSSAEDNSNPLGQRDDGSGFSKAIEGALFVAKTDKSSVNLVKTHGSGTPVNNVAEKSALTRSLDDFIATSYKQRIGHTMGASGLLETGLLLKTTKNNFVPKIPNRTSNDDVFLSHDAISPSGNILSLAAGMGNIYSAAIFSVEV